MSSTVKVIIAALFAVGLFYGLTSSSLLQRISFDIYECHHKDYGDIKLWFNEKAMAVGQSFDFTRDGMTSTPQILQILDNTVSFEDSEVNFRLDISTNRLIQGDQGGSSGIFCLRTERIQDVI